MRESLQHLDQAAPNWRGWHRIPWRITVGPDGPGRDAVLFLRDGLFLFAWDAGSLAQDLQRQPRLLPRMLFSAQTHGLSLA
jgi:hypothetical protein